MKRKWLFCILMPVLFIPALHAQTRMRFDICIYGATSAGVIAACTAKRMGKSVLLIATGKHVGGLTTGGLGYTDIGNKYAVTGLARDFYRRVGVHYGKFETWIFEPHIAEDVYRNYISRAGLQVLYENRLTGVKKQNSSIVSITLESSVHPGPSAHQTISAGEFIDCSYEGDLMAQAGVSYFTGRESNNLYHETYNGVQLRDKHQFPDGIDPYKIPGHPESGLLWGISGDSLQPRGTGDKRIQAYTFRVCLTEDPANLIPITRPANYDPSHYELLLRVLAKKPASNLSSFLKFDLMPNHKTDINNNGPISTDMIGMNYDYPDGDYATRDRIQKAHEDYVKGLLYFIGHDPRMPADLREQMLKWGYPKDEYSDNGGWSPQMYVREVRRMNGDYVMTQANCEGREVVEDGIGLAAYTMDSHNCERIVANGMVKNEGDVQIGGFGPYPISYRAVVPKETECRNLLVPVCLSATHIAYGSIRMEPVFMVLGQSAAVAAVLAEDGKIPVQRVNVKKLQHILASDPLADGSTPEILVDDRDSAHVVIKGNWTIGHTGSYGPTLLEDNGNASGKNSVRFIPSVTRAGRYRVYAYFTKVAGGSKVTRADLYDGSIIRQATISRQDILVQGQTSGEWVSLGACALPSGHKAYVEISNAGADGKVIADAILFIPDFSSKSKKQP